MHYHSGALLSLSSMHLWPFINVYLLSHEKFWFSSECYNFILRCPSWAFGFLQLIHINPVFQENLLKLFRRRPASGACTLPQQVVVDAVAGTTSLSMERRPSSAPSIAVSSTKRVLPAWMLKKDVDATSVPGHRTSQLASSTRISKKRKNSDSNSERDSHS